MKDELELTPLESLFQDAAPARDDCPEPAAEANGPAVPAGLAGLAGQAEAAGTAPQADGPEAAAAPAAAAAAAPPADAPAAAMPALAPAAAPALDDKPYEALVRELEQIVRRLESGDITLDQSMELFARGIELSRRCQEQLDAIEKKITILIENPDGSLSERPFADDGNE